MSEELADMTGGSAVLLILDRLKNIDETMRAERQSSALSRKRMYDKLEQTDEKVDKIENRVERLEHAITTMSPTVAEFLMYKAQVQGAGKLGKFLWWVGGVMLGAAAALTTQWHNIVSWFSAR